MWTMDITRLDILEWHHVRVKEYDEIICSKQSNQTHKAHSTNQWTSSYFNRILSMQTHRQTIPSQSINYKKKKELNNET